MLHHPQPTHLKRTQNILRLNGGAAKGREGKGRELSQKRWKLARATEADLAEVQELTRQQYGPDTLAHPDYWRWLTQENPSGPTCTWLAKANGEIIATLMARPVRAKVGDCQVLAHFFTNALVRPDFRRQGVNSRLHSWAFEDSLRLGAAIDFIAPGPSLKGAWRKYGVSVIGPASPLMLKPLDVGAMLAFKGIKSRLIHWLAGAGYKLIAPFLRRRWFNRPDPDLTIGEVTSFDERFDRFWDRVKQKYHTLLVRDAAFLQWRYKDVPLKPARCFAATDRQGEVVAYIAFRGTHLEGIATGMILDLLIEPSERGRKAGNQLVVQATRQFKHDRLALGTCIMLRHTDEIRVLREQGYIPCPRSLEPHPIMMLYKLNTDQVAHSDFTPQDRWFFTLGDWGIDAL